MFISFCFVMTLSYTKNFRKGIGIVDVDIAKVAVFCNFMQHTQHTGTVLLCKTMPPIQLVYCDILL